MTIKAKKKKKKDINAVVQWPEIISCTLFSQPESPQSGFSPKQKKSANVNPQKGTTKISKLAFLQVQAGEIRHQVITNCVLHPHTGLCLNVATEEVFSFHAPLLSH